MSSATSVIKKIEKDQKFFPESSEKETINFLKALIILIQPKNVLEIGTYLGYSTCAIADGLGKMAILTTIDQKDYFSTYYRLLNNEIREKIKIINKRSDKYLLNLENDTGFDLIFIDASHDYLSVFSDFFLSLSHTSKQCVYIFHDSKSSGVKMVLKLIQFANVFSLCKTSANIELPTPEKPQIAKLKKANKIPKNLSCISGLAIVTISNNFFYPIFYRILSIIYLLNKKFYKKLL